MTQELVAKKCGILKDKQASDDMILQDYLNMYRQPLTDESVHAIMKLTEVPMTKKKKGAKKKKKLETKLPASAFSKMNKKLLLGAKPKKAKETKATSSEEVVVST